MDILIATNVLPIGRKREGLATTPTPPPPYVDGGDPAILGGVSFLAMVYFVLRFVIGIAIGVMAVRLNWRCNRSVLYAILTWFASMPYLVYRALFGVACGR